MGKAVHTMRRSCPGAFRSWLNMMRQVQFNSHLLHQPWKSFDIFVRDMGGERPDGMRLVRLDGNGRYTPENCCWMPYPEARKFHHARVHRSQQRVAEITALHRQGLPMPMIAKKLGVSRSYVYTMVSRWGIHLDDNEE